eukprot:m.244675 g.244675  ORF g.244675 m.244675 type:complete len:54 (+) comp17467_c0_seq16:3607-3768(+)
MLGQRELVSFGIRVANATIHFDAAALVAPALSGVSKGSRGLAGASLIRVFSSL